MGDTQGTIAHVTSLSSEPDWFEQPRRRPHVPRQTFQLLIPAGASDSALRKLKVQLQAAFGNDVWLELRIDQRSKGHCRYRLSGPWHRPVAVRNTLVQLFSLFKEDADDCTPI